MAARDSVAQLIIDLKTQGLGDIQFLKKELKQVSSQSKISEKSIEGLQKEISKFGAATKNSVEGIKGQVSAFQKLRAQSDFQGRAYKSLTKDIVALNRELKNRLGLEKELDAGRGGRRGGSLSPGGGGDRGLVSSKLDKNWGTGGTEQFASRMASLQALLVARTFDNITDQQRKFLTEFRRSESGTYSMRDLKGSSDAFKKIIMESNAQFLDMEARLGKGRGKHSFDQSQLLNQGKLNQVQKEALNVQDDLNITSTRYLEVLTKINAETGVQTRILGSQDAKAANRTAIARANIITSTDAVAQQQARARSYLYSSERALYGSQVGPTGMADSTHFGYRGMGPATREFQAKNPRAQWFQQMVGWMVPEWRSPTLKAALAEQDDQKRPYLRGFRKDRTDPSAQFPSFNAWSAGPTGGLPKGQGYSKLIRRQMGEVVQTIKDPMGLGADPKYPRTEFGLGEELKNLQGMLPHLENGTKPWLAVVEKIEEKQKEINKLVKEGTNAIEARKKKIAETVNPRVNQKLLPPARGLGDKNRYNIMSAAGVFDTGFTADKYGPQLETQDQLTTRLQKTIKVRTNSIKTITEHRSKLEEIRRTLDPTSAKFKSVANSITQADKSLAKLNKTSKGFGKQGLLGFGQSVLGGAYFGGPGGALGAGIGQMFGGQSGAATGGLIGAQVARPVTEFIGGSTDYAAQYSKAQLTLKQITKDAGSYGVAMDAVKTAVEEFNVPQEVAIRGMTRLSAAVLGSGGNINNAAEAFLNTTAAIKGTAGSADDVKSAITAMVQIYSKGKVSAEELSGQLGERFPGAVVKFAEANNISAQSLQKNLKDGTVGLDMLSKFITSLGDEYIPLAKKIAASNEEAGARSRIAMNKLRIAVGEELIPIGKEFQEITAELLIDLVPALTKLAEIGSSTFSVLAETIKFLVNNFDILAPAITTATVALVAYNIQQQVANKTGIILMARNGIAAMIKLTRAIKSAASAQAVFNAITSANPYVAAATAIAAIASSIWAVKSANDALKDEPTLLGDITGMTLKETKKVLEEVKAGYKAYQDVVNNPESTEAARKSASKLLDVYKEQITALETQITKLGGVVVFDPMTKGAESAGNKIYKGLSGGIEKFTDSVKNMGEEVANVTASWFDRMASSLADFVMTGKLKFKEFARSVIADIAKMIAKQMIFNMIAGLSSGANFLGGLFGGKKAVDTTFGTGIPSNPSSVFGSTNALGNVYGKNGIVPFYKGGIVNSPTLFPFAKGTGLMGEAGPEAIVPLKRGRDGKLGIAGGGGATTVNVSVDAKGTKVEGDGKQMAQLGRMIGSAIEMELAKQKRPGGLLA